ncbi:hypothetical protein Q6D67_00785 [Haliea sp. E1-2-M8]|uniref:hypothetical protein n=1 Tax=Haliea sp. E1-2-M8 TaxID=3064706 RepID=UPI002716FADB|nr:hypothetical protein [Haliea sp. E1-2-M8]MDO8860220.1 hypothetical protein [Haliea sp. E1-2-M8]
MRFPVLASALLCAVFTTAPALAAEDFPGVEKLMSAEQFEAAGLHKLTPAEREALDRWLLSYTAEEAPEMLRSNPEVRAAEESIRIEARINPPFEGWSGDTLFYLDNGQVWRQRLRGRYFHRGDDTAVVIEKNLLGFYKMTVTASGKSIGVTRLR